MKIKKILIAVLIIIVLIVLFIFGIKYINNKSFNEEYLSKVVFSEELYTDDNIRTEDSKKMNDQKIVKLSGDEIAVTYKYTRGDKVVYNDENGVEYIFTNDKLTGFFKSLPSSTDKNITKEEAEKIAYNFIAENVENLEGYELSSYNYRYGEHNFIYTKKYLDYKLNNSISINVFDTGEITTYQNNYNEKYEGLNNINIDKEKIEKALKIKVAEKLNVNIDDCIIEDGSISIINDKLVYLTSYNIKGEIIHAYDIIAFCSGFFIGQAQNTRKDLVINTSRRYTS